MGLARSGEKLATIRSNRARASVVPRIGKSEEGRRKSRTILTRVVIDRDEEAEIPQS